MGWNLVENMFMGIAANMELVLYKPLHGLR